MTILDAIRATKEEEVRSLRASGWHEALERSAGDAPEASDVLALLKKNGRHVIAEVKRASPSRGDLDLSLDPSATALTYMQAGASAVSVLTDVSYFKGSVDDFRSVRQTVRLPLLRKDFIIDEVQILESRALGADMVLLIVRMLSDSELISFRTYAEKLGMTALVEVHSDDDLARAVGSGARCIGVNNRDLATFDVSLRTSLDLSARIPSDVFSVSESGVLSPEDADQLYDAGYDAVLIGEGLVRAEDKRAFIRRVRRV